jgi:uncharacterized protein
MPIYPAGSLNTAALSAPDLYVQQVAPRTRYINGVPTDILGIVGVAAWGAVNSPMLIGSTGDAALAVGSQQVRKYDLATAIAVSMQLGASNLRVVRVTDGTDTAAIATLNDTAAAPGVTLTACHTGSLGNTLGATLTSGTAVGSWKLTLSMTGVQPEVFDNIGGSGAGFWQNLVNAVNNGQSGIRGPSQLVIAAVGASSLAPQQTGGVQSVQCAGGTDGAAGVTDATLVGVDGVLASARKGMYALRGVNAQVINLVDVTDASQWPAMLAFGDSEGAYLVTQGPAGAHRDTVAASLNAAGVDGYALKLLVGDWVYWYDTVNGQSRMLAPATFSAARIAGLSPHLSVLNKALSNVTGTQRSLAQQPYSNAEIGAINTARLDVITNPCPGGSYFGHRSGLNCASNPTQNGDNYTRMTHFLSLTLAASFGWVIGEPHTTDLRRQVKSTIESFLQNLVDQGMIGDPNGGAAFSVQIDQSNNPDSRVALGYLQADVQVKYLSIVRYFLINLEGGQSVSITVANNPRS